MSINLKKVIQEGIVKINSHLFTNVNTLTINKNKIFVNGQDVTTKDIIFNITIEGKIPEINIDVCNVIKINGDVSFVKTGSGNVEIAGNIGGDVKTISGDIRCEGNMEKDVQTTSGDIQVKGDIQGNVKTISGDINCNN